MNLDPKNILGAPVATGAGILGAGGILAIPAPNTGIHWLDIVLLVLQYGGAVGALIVGALGGKKV